MKKRFSLFILLTALCFCLIGVFLTCPTVYADSQLNVSLSNPRAIASSPTELFVADTIEENGAEYTIVHRIGESVDSYFLDLNVPGETLDMCVNENYIFLLQQDRILIYDYTLADSAVKVFNQSGLLSFAVSGDYLFFAYTSNGSNYIGAFLYGQAQLTALNPHNYYSTQIRFLEAAQINKAIVFFDTQSGSVAETLKTELNRVVKDETVPSSALSIPDGVLGVVNYGGHYFYTEEKIKAFVNSTDDYDFWDSDSIPVKDICIVGRELFVLCDYLSQKSNNGFYMQPRIKKYRLSEEIPTQSLTLIEGWEIGASKVNFAPVDYTLDEIKVAKVKGYPSNVVYTFADNDSFCPIEKNKLTISDTVLVLGKTEGFLFICLNGCFGWIPDSNKIEYDTLATSYDDKAVTVLDAKLYTLPFKNDDFFTQTSLQKDIEVTVKAKINGFYLVQYQTEQETFFGFCVETCIGAFREEEVYTKYLRKRANPKAGKKIALYLNDNLFNEENNFVLDQNQQQVLIKSGEEVRLYETEENGVCLVGVFAGNVLIKGYIESENLLIDINKGLTNAQVLALALFAIVILVVIFVIIIRIRAKKLIQHNSNEDNS